MIWASTLSAPTRVAWTRSEPVPLTVAPVTSSPTPFSIGIGSPVTIDSSTDEWPSTTLPSTGILSPGRTSTTSPGSTDSMANSTTTPSRSTRAVRA